MMCTKQLGMVRGPDGSTPIILSAEATDLPMYLFAVYFSFLLLFFSVIVILLKFGYGVVSST